MRNVKTTSSCVQDGNICVMLLIITSPVISSVPRWWENWEDSHFYHATLLLTLTNSHCTECLAANWGHTRKPVLFQDFVDWIRGKGAMSASTKGAWGICSPLEALPPLLPPPSPSEGKNGQKISHFQHANHILCPRCPPTKKKKILVPPL